MSRSLRGVAAAGAGYLIGAVPWADFVSRAAGGSDLRTVGTRNPGAMNAAHVLGRGWGAAVVVGDVGKGVIAARAGRAMAGDLGANLAATGAVAGHCFPPARTGGKGVATSVGQVAATFPAYLPVDIAVGLSTSAAPWFRQRTRAATTVASLVWIGCAALWWQRELPNPGGVRPSIWLPLTAASSSAVIAARFHAGAGQVDAFNEHPPPPTEAA